jgi:hypothetical protein
MLEGQFALWMLVGVTVFILGDMLVERRFGTAGADGGILAMLLNSDHSVS